MANQQLHFERENYSVKIRGTYVLVYIQIEFCSIYTIKSSNKQRIDSSQKKATYILA